MFKESIKIAINENAIEMYAFKIMKLLSLNTNKKKIKPVKYDNEANNTVENLFVPLIVFKSIY